MNATCALFGHEWRWCFALRLRQCHRCWQFDCADVPHTPCPDIVVGAAPDAPQPVRSPDHAAGATTAAVRG